MGPSSSYISSTGGGGGGGSEAGFFQGVNMKAKKINNIARPLPPQIP